MMRDEIFDRDYQDNRESLNAGIDHTLALFARHLWLGFALLSRRRWQAPWQRDQVRPRTRRHTGIA